MQQVSIFPSDPWYFVLVEDLDRYCDRLDDWVNQGGAFWPEKRMPDQIPAGLADLGVSADRIASVVQDLEDGKHVFLRQPPSF